MQIKKAFLSAALVLATAAAQAGIVFSDDFEANSTGLNLDPIGWTVSDGKVDLIGNGFYDFYPGNGVYVDLDGSVNDAGVMSIDLALTGGVAYTASLTMGGSTRGDLNQVAIGFGSQSLNASFASGDPLRVEVLSFTPATSGWYALSIANAGGDNRGAILTNVVVESMAPIPEPSSFALAFGGLAVLGRLARRHRG